MKVITAPHYNRPQCTKAQIESLRRSIGIDDWHVVFVCEPGCDEVVQLCQNANLNSYEVVINEHLLGIWDNKRQCLDKSFNDYKAIFNLHLEDDVLIAKDALLFYDWCCQTYSTVKNIFTINGFNKIAAMDFYSRKCTCCNNPFYGMVARREAYNSIGFAMWYDRYTDLINSGGWNGSDIWLEGYRASRGLSEVYPILSRINNIGFHQGISFDDNVANTLIQQGIIPDVLQGSTVDNLKWSKRPNLLTNEHGCEWVKLNQTKCRSRKDPEFHRKTTYLSFWADSVDYEIKGFFE